MCHLKFPLLVLTLLIAVACAPDMGDPCYGRSDSAECNLYKSQLQTTLEASERHRIAEATRQTNEMNLQATRQASEVKQAEALANAGATATIESARSQAAIDQANAQATITAAKIAENKSNADATATAVANDIQLSQSRIAATATAQALLDHAAIENAKAEAELEAAKWQTRVDLFVRFALGLVILVIGAGIALKIFHAVYQWLRNRGNTFRDADGRIWIKVGNRLIDPRLLLRASIPIDGSDDISESTALRLKERDQVARVYELEARTGHNTIGDDADWVQSSDQTETVAPAQIPAVAGMPALPSAPAFAELSQTWQPTTDRMLLGFGLDGPIYGGIDDLLSVGISGRPKQGKTTLLRFIYAQCRQLGVKVLVWDLHDDVVHHLAGATAYTTIDAIAGSARLLMSELDQRIEQHEHRNPVLVLVDEFPLLALAECEDALLAIRRIVLEGRKVSMFALLSAQGMPAEMFRGGLVRDALSSRFVFRTSLPEARRSGLDKESAHLVQRLQPGCAVIDGPVNPQIVAIPNTTPEDLKLLPASQAASAPSNGHSGRGEGSDPEAGREGALEVDPEKRNRVRELILQHRSLNQIVREVYGVTGGHAYQRAAREVSQILASLVT